MGSFFVVIGPAFGSPSFFFTSGWESGRKSKKTPHGVWARGARWNDAARDRRRGEKVNEKDGRSRDGSAANTFGKQSQQQLLQSSQSSR